MFIFGVTLTLEKNYSYIKWVEAGGARAVPVIIGKSKEYYKQVRTRFLSW